MNKSKLTGTLATVAVVLALLIWGFRPKPVPVDIVTATVGPVTVSVREQARTRVKDRFDISAPVAGFAPRLELEVGDRVTAGDVLVELLPVPASVLDQRSRQTAEAEVARAEAALKAAEAALEVARSAADLARTEHLRLQSLYQRGTISVSELDRARASRNQARAELRSAESNVEVARQGLRYARAALVQGNENGNELSSFPIETPVDGTILQVVHESAGIVQPGEALLELGDPASLEVVAEVLTSDAVKLQPGMAVELERWGGETILFGEVRRIEPSAYTKVSALGVEEQRTRVIVDLVSPRAQWAALGHGFRVEARFIVWRDPATLRVPNGALFQSGGKTVVFGVHDGRARLQTVEAGRRGERNTQILSGLEPGQWVIAHPDNAVENGARVVAFQSVAR